MHRTTSRFLVNSELAAVSLSLCLCLCLCRCLASERRDTESADLQHRGQLQLTQQADEAAAWKHREGYTMLTTGVIGTKQTER